MTSSSYNPTSPDGLFGSSLLEEDLFAFGTLPLIASDTSSSQSPSTNTLDYSSFDFSQCLVSQIIDNADPSVVSLFDNESSAMFSSLFPDVKPAAPVAASPVQTSLDAAQAAQLLTSTEAALAANPGLAPAVARLRQSLAAAAAAQVAPSPALTSVSSFSPGTANLATPFLGFESFDFGANVSPVSQVAASPMLDAFAVPWGVHCGRNREETKRRR
ncbi:UNVERIFIED_CONTAM: hypothetical protein HDU68_005221 [Siphonaria sp. JEL0065]|nr:hypothetical protein HDU68_005221 [Siphonaria sp. JEL0065]